MLHGMQSARNTTTIVTTPLTPPSSALPMVHQLGLRAFSKSCCCRRSSTTLPPYLHTATQTTHNIHGAGGPAVVGPGVRH